MFELGQQEDIVFQNRHTKELQRNQNAKRRKAENFRASMAVPDVQPHEMVAPAGIKALDSRRHENQVAAQLLRQELGDAKRQEVNDSRDAITRDITPSGQAIDSTLSKKRPAEEQGASALDNDDMPFDNVRLWESGWKERYYREKFKVELTDTKFRRRFIYTLTTSVSLRVMWKVYAGYLSTIILDVLHGSGSTPFIMHLLRQISLTLISLAP